MSKTLMKFSVSIEMETEEYQKVIDGRSNEEVGKFVAAQIQKEIDDEFGSDGKITTHHLYTEDQK